MELDQGSGSALKSAVRDFWENAPCGDVHAEGDTLEEQLANQARTRYELEPYIFDFARFPRGAGKDVLEIGVGMGADHLEWAKVGPRSLTGVDLTERAIELTGARLWFNGLHSELMRADAEQLPFPDNSFDLVYSWGVLQHTPNTPRAITEVYRVLRPGGSALVMVYHLHSLTAFMLWLRYGLLTGHPSVSLTDVYSEHMQSPGKKAYTVGEARGMFSAFSSVTVRPALQFGDLLEGGVGRRHQGLALSIARKVWPRWLVRRFGTRFGTMLVIEAVK
jgi:SAM-dependent methyltransferase